MRLIGWMCLLTYNYDLIYHQENIIRIGSSLGRRDLSVLPF